MMNKILNWTFGSLFRTLGRILAFFLVGGVLAYFISTNNVKLPNFYQLIGLDYIKASTINVNTPKGYNIHWVGCNTFNCSGGVIYRQTGLTDFGTSSTTYDSSDLTNNIDTIASVYTYNFNSDNTYTFNFRVYFGGNNYGLNYLINNKNYNSWDYYVLGYKNSSDGYLDDYINSASCTTRYDDSTSNGFLVQCNVALNTNVSRINIRIDTNWESLSYSPYDFTSMKVNLLEVNEIEGQGAIIDKQTNSLINNQNQNTQDIINNQNQNTQDIINNQNELLGNKCSNLFDVSKFSSGTLDNSNGSLVFTNLSNITASRKKDGNITFNVSSAYVGVVSNYVSVDSSSTYYIKYLNTDYYSHCILYDTNKNFISVVDNQNTINTTSNTKYLRCAFVSSSVSSGTHNIGKLTLNDDNKAFCEFGSYESKVDNLSHEVSSGFHDLQDTLTDSSLNNSDISDELGNLTTTNNSLGFFSTFLTLPLTWIQNILASNQTCTPIELPLPYMNNKVLTLPCMFSFWESLGLLHYLIQACWLAVVGVRIFNGLFVLTVDSISSKDNVDELTKIKSWEL